VQQKPEFRGISLIVESPTTQSKLDDPISTKFHTQIGSTSLNPVTTKAMQKHELSRYPDVSDTLHARAQPVMNELVSSLHTV
jgi:hypothetical protein